MNNAELEDMIRSILADKISGEQQDGARHPAIFSEVGAAVNAAHAASRQYINASLKLRADIVAALRAELLPLVEEMARRTLEETGMGNVADKIVKNVIAINNTPGVEDLTTQALTGDGGMVLFELSPFGVIGAIAPSTNPTETIINNAIGMLAAGNAVYFSPHPGAKNVSLWLIEKVEQIARRVSGIASLVVTVREPSFESTREMMAHPQIALLAVTGGPAIVRMALTSGKKVIGAGPGNPPVLVDETACPEKAGRDIVDGASFDHNILCFAEKCAILVDSIAGQVIESMEKHGAWRLRSRADVDKLRRVVVNEKGEANKALVGKSASVILQAAGLSAPAEPRLIIAEVQSDDALVSVEQLMPVLPIVRVNDFEAGLALALRVENGLHHTAVLHSQNVSRLNRMAKIMQTSIFVKNGPSFAGLGVGGEGFTTYTIATPTGEGTTSASSFARRRRCVLTSGFSIR